MKVRKISNSTTDDLHVYDVNGLIIVLPDECEIKFGSKGFRRLKNSALKRHIPFRIQDVTELIAWWISTPDECAYCGITEMQYNKLVKKIKKKHMPSPFLYKMQGFLRNHKYNLMTYDRVDSNGAYEITNIVKACHICNAAKGFILSANDMNELGPKILERIKRELYG